MRKLRKNAPVDERLILALDVKDITKAKEVVELVQGSVAWVKIRPELLVRHGDENKLMDHLKDLNISVLADFQSATTLSQLENYLSYAKSFEFEAVSIKPDQEHMLKTHSSLRGNSANAGIFTPVLLTQIGVGDGKFQNEAMIEEFISQRVATAEAMRLSGVITSCREIFQFSKNTQEAMVFIAPGIRDESFDLVLEQDDQKRTCTISEALQQGADYVMIGRPITEADNPSKVATDCLARISKVLTSSKGSE